MNYETEFAKLLTTLNNSPTYKQLIKECIELATEDKAMRACRNCYVIAKYCEAVDNGELKQNPTAQRINHRAFATLNLSMLLDSGAIDQLYAQQAPSTNTMQ